MAEATTEKATRKRTVVRLYTVEVYGPRDGGVPVLQLDKLFGPIATQLKLPLNVRNRTGRDGKADPTVFQVRMGTPKSAGNGGPKGLRLSPAQIAEIAHRPAIMAVAKSEGFENPEDYIRHVIASVK